MCWGCSRVEMRTFRQNYKPVSTLLCFENMTSAVTYVATPLFWTLFLRKSDCLFLVTAHGKDRLRLIAWRAVILQGFCFGKQLSPKEMGLCYYCLCWVIEHRIKNKRLQNVDVSKNVPQNKSPHPQTWIIMGGITHYEGIRIVHIRWKDGEQAGLHQALLH